KPGQEFDKQKNHLRVSAESKNVEFSVAELDNWDTLKINVEAADAALNKQQELKLNGDGSKFKDNITEAEYDEYMKVFNNRKKLVKEWNEKLALKEKLRWNALIVNRRFKEIDRKKFNES